MTANVANVRKEPPDPAKLVERLCRSVQAATDHGSALSGALLDAGDGWHAGLVAGSVVSLRSALHTLELVQGFLTNKVPEEVSYAVRSDQEQDSAHKG